MKYISSPAESIPFQDSYFDIVSSFNSLDHVADIQASISEIKRVLKLGGFFLLITDVNHKATPNEPQGFSWNIVNKFMPNFEIINERHYRRKANGIYQSIQQDDFFDNLNPENNPGVLSVIFRKIN